MKENDLPDMLKQINNHEFSECQHLVNKDVVNMSQEDLKFKEILKNGKELVGGHYQVPLPFKKDEINLPNNRSQAEKRFACLERKLSRNPQFKQCYMKFMNELILKGYARESTSAVKAGKCWYLPHHGVYHPNKPGKIRVVFDLSAEFHGTSVKRKIREEKIAVTGDTEAMYHQVKVPENQRCFLRFLWWKDSESSKFIVDHEMTARVFCGISLPSCSNYALKKTAADNIKKYGEDVSSILRQNFYVDDMLKSFPSAKIAVDMIYKVKSLCKEGGFNLTKFSSNHIEVLKSIPDECRKDGVKDKDLNLGIVPEDKPLRVKWNTQEDTLGFIIKMDDTPATRCGLRAAFSSVYHPLALGAPFLLKGRLIIQRLCKNNLNWDEPIDDDTV